MRQSFRRLAVPRLSAANVTATLLAVALGLAACGEGGGAGGTASGSSGGGASSSGGGNPPATNSPPNSPPVLGALTFSTNENIPLAGQLTATDPDGDTLQFKQTSGPAQGAVTSFQSSGAFVYQPKADFTGSDSFGVQVIDSAGNATPGVVSITVRVNQPPTAGNLVLRADGAALSNINVLAKAQDPDGDPLTVTIEQAPLVGTATVNPDGSIALSGLPSGFKGLTRFKYRVTDPSAAYATGTVAVFVGADPFRVAFVGDATGNGAPEVYLTDFVSPLSPVTAATSGNLRLQGFVVSDSGATLVYRRADITAPSTTDLSFVQTANLAEQTRIVLPAGEALVQDANGKDEFEVSPDGQWIAAVAGNGSADSLYVLGVSSPSTVINATPAGTLSVSEPRFSIDSKNLYFLVSSTPGGGARSLYTVALSDPSASALVSAPNASGDDVTDYAVAPDQARILLQAVRGGVVGLYFNDPLHLQTEFQVNQSLGFAQWVASSTIDLPPGLGGSSLGDQVAYTIDTALVGGQAYLASVSATPSPQTLGPQGSSAVAFRPDDAALLYSMYSASSGTQIYEASGPTEQLVGSGVSGLYDSTGNIVLLVQSQLTAGMPSGTPVLAVSSRGAFGNAQQIGTSGMGADYFDTSGFDRAVVLIGEGPMSGTVPANVRLALFNALAGGAPLYLAGFNTPLNLTSPASRVVTY